MACDSQTTNSNGAKLTLADGKIVRVGPMLVGGDGTHAVLHFARHVYRGFALPQGDHENPAVSGLEARAIHFTDALRDWLKGRDMLSKSQEFNAELPGHLLCAYRDRFVLVDGGGYLVWVESPFWAIGCGGAEARGAMWAAERCGVIRAAPDFARVGVDAAMAFDSACGPPVCIEWTEP